MGDGDVIEVHPVERHPVDDVDRHGHGVRSVDQHAIRNGSGEYCFFGPTELDVADGDTIDGDGDIVVVDRLEVEDAPHPYVDRPGAGSDVVQLDDCLHRPAEREHVEPVPRVVARR